ncbi:hypothetical protein Pth03_32180 [Planotetraspora thailandica]|uniref:Uncharacterized protein n=1 Tax=Planotetraspora thailandica TaxID=487172 RepID=A0A8J3XVX9_9ACTN|nr:hypothetical protein [Planotetraspora thailandica]GII54829.1 hypothetical protein Pth03_32180 [Planotetraspora thailandica]
MNRFVHVMPLDDVITHEGTPDCICGPGGQIVSAVDLMDQTDDWLHAEETDDSSDHHAEAWEDEDSGDWPADEERPGEELETGDSLLVCVVYHHYALRPCHEWEASPELQPPWR